MITNSEQDFYKHITKVSILDNRKVYYPLKLALQERDITVDETYCLTILPMPEDINFPASSKLTDAGTLWDYKIQLSVNNQHSHSAKELLRFQNRKVIVVFHHAFGKMIFGCNEMPLRYLYGEDNSTTPSAVNGYTVTLTGSSIIPKVMR